MTSIEEALGQTRRAFIRGEAGSGKTTLLQWLAVRCGHRDFDGPMRDWNGCVPLFIRLRRYSGEELPAPEDFLREAGRNIAHTMPLNWVHDLLRSGRAVVPVNLSGLARATDLDVEINGYAHGPVRGREKLHPSVKVRFRK